MSVASGRDPQALAADLRSGDRRALAQAITLAESGRTDHRAQAQALLAAVLPDTGGSVRVGVTGAPGVGKSMLIEALGVRLVDRGRRVAVLAVDPSSAVSGGSVLGDKTRMEELARRSDAFIRPSPSGGVLGGVARRTRDAVLLVEAWGADVALVETVGIGQSETAVASTVDVSVLLVAPGGGDDLQGIKRGVMEVADIVAVTKADGELRAQAERTRADYAAAAGLVGAHGGLVVLACSAIEDEGVDELWGAVVDRHERLVTSGELARRRSAQACEWMWREVREGLADAARAAQPVARRLGDIEAEVSAGRLLPEVAASLLVDAVLQGSGSASDH